MYNLIGRIIYTKMINAGIDEYIAVRTGLEIPSKALDYVLNYIRTLPNDARFNIPWDSQLTGDTKVEDEAVYNIGCVIGKPNATGISSPRSYHNPPPLIGDTIYCMTLAMIQYGSENTLDMNNMQTYFIDPDGNKREAIWVDSTGYHT
jgi:hypothetical protein